MRLRNQFVYGGAHTLRWSGRDLQPHNLTRMTPDPTTLDNMKALTPVESIEKLSTCIRPCIRAPKGKKLVVADLNAIEVRVLFWLAGSEEGLEMFRKGICPYKKFATDFFHVPYEEVTKVQRGICKPPVLGCGFGIGPGQERRLLSGQVEWTGLKKYAEGMGIDLPWQQCCDMVKLYRNKYPEVPILWSYMEDAFLAAYKTRKQQQVGHLYFEATKEAVKILLPSGRCIHYLNPHAYFASGGVKISFDGLRTGGWGRQSTWGGRLTENVVQAVARDVLAEGMLRADEVRMNVVGHVHDELICEEPIEHEISVEVLEQCLTDPIDWAPGLPLAAEGYEGEHYSKG